MLKRRENLATGSLRVSDASEIGKAWSEVEDGCGIEAGPGEAASITTATL